MSDQSFCGYFFWVSGCHLLLSPFSNAIDLLEPDSERGEQGRSAAGRLLSKCGPPTPALCNPHPPLPGGDLFPAWQRLWCMASDKLVPSHPHPGCIPVSMDGVLLLHEGFSLGIPAPHCFPHTIHHGHLVHLGSHPAAALEDQGDGQVWCRVDLCGCLFRPDRCQQLPDRSGGLAVVLV